MAHPEDDQPGTSQSRLDERFAVVPRSDCPHVERWFADDWGKTLVDAFARCETCGADSECWRCLTCQHAFCSRYVKGHMVDHHRETEHPLCVSFSDLSVWCYSCDDYVTNPKFTPLEKALIVSKFGEEVLGNMDGAQIGTSSGVRLANCDHVRDHVSKDWDAIDANALSLCQECEDKSDNWQCLMCAGVFCSRYTNGHQLDHYAKTKHSLCISFGDFSVWCNMCDDYVSDPQLETIKSKYRAARRGNRPDTGVEDITARIAKLT